MKSRGQIPQLVGVACIVMFAIDVRAEERFGVPRDVAATISDRCIKCHSGDAAEGEVRLDELAKMALNDRLESEGAIE